MHKIFAGLLVLAFYSVSFAAFPSGIGHKHHADAVSIGETPMATESSGFHSPERARYRKQALESEMRNEQSAKKAKDAERRRLLTIECPAHEDAAWAAQKAKNLKLDEGRFRMDWTRTDPGASCVAAGFEP